MHIINILSLGCSGALYFSLAPPEAPGQFPEHVGTYSLCFALFYPVYVREVDPRSFGQRAKGPPPFQTLFLDPGPQFDRINLAFG